MKSTVGAREREVEYAKPSHLPGHALTYSRSENTYLPGRNRCNIQEVHPELTKTRVKPSDSSSSLLAAF